MKKILFITILLFSTVSTFGQQFLWSTIDINEELKHIPYEDVTKEVLEFYDLYEKYYDNSGYTKESFLEYAGDNIEVWNWVKDIEESTVFALKIPLEKGSVIYVVCVDKNNVNLVGFSNITMSGYNHTYNGEIESHRKRFEKWFKTLLN